MPVIGIALVLGVSACTTATPAGGGGGSGGPLPFANGKLCIVGDSMLAGPSLPALQAWLAANHVTTRGTPRNGAGFTRELAPGGSIAAQIDRMGDFDCEHLLMSTEWNDMVMNDTTSEEIEPLIDDFLDRAAAGGVRCMRWLLNRSDDQYVEEQARNWIRQPLAEFLSRMPEMEENSVFLRLRASESPLSGTLDLDVIEWGQMAASTLRPVNIPASGTLAAVIGVPWSGLYDKSQVGVADQVSQGLYGGLWTDTDKDTVHPGDKGGPGATGSDVEVHMIDQAFRTCPA